jgi:cytochrome c2
MTLRLNILILLLAGMLALPVLAASEVSEAEAIFGKRCSGCHTYGKGIRVGPDLKGVTDRHPRSWLLLFIQSSQSVIRGGDPTAVALFRQFKQQRMPDHDLSLKQIESLLDYLASGGLESAGQDERDADTATPAEINGGRRLFYGEAHLAHAGPACSSCHSVQDAGWARGGSLGPNLTAAYLKYQDKALTSFLERPCFPRAPAAFLTPEESFDLKAYLRQVSLSQTQLTMHAGTLHPGQTATLIGSRGSHRNTKGETP